MSLIQLAASLAGVAALAAGAVAPAAALPATPPRAAPAATSSADTGPAVQATLDRPAVGPSGTPQAPISSLLDLGGATTTTGLALTRSGASLYANALAGPQRTDGEPCLR